MKTETLNIRIEQDLKNDLIKLAFMDNRKMSDYVVLQLKKVVKEELKKHQPPTI